MTAILIHDTLHKAIVLGVAHGASLIKSIGENVVCSVSWIRMADTLNTFFTSCLYCKTIIFYR